LEKQRQRRAGNARTPHGLTGESATSLLTSLMPLGNVLSLTTGAVRAFGE
jgi:hypothetical protein